MDCCNVHSNIIALQAELHHKRRCVSVSADKLVNTLVLLFFFFNQWMRWWMMTRVIFANIYMKILLSELFNRSVVDFQMWSLVGSAPTIWKVTNKLSPGFNSSVMSNIRTILSLWLEWVSLVLMRQVSFVFLKADLKMVGRWFKSLFLYVTL